MKERERECVYVRVGMCVCVCMYTYDKIVVYHSIFQLGGCMNVCV